MCTFTCYFAGLIKMVHAQTILQDKLCWTQSLDYIYIYPIVCSACRSLRLRNLSMRRHSCIDIHVYICIYIYMHACVYILYIYIYIKYYIYIKTHVQEIQRCRARTTRPTTKVWRLALGRAYELYAHLCQANSTKRTQSLPARVTSTQAAIVQCVWLYIYIRYIYICCTNVCLTVVEVPRRTRPRSASIRNKATVYRA